MPDLDIVGSKEADRLTAPSPRIFLHNGETKPAFDIRPSLIESVEIWMYLCRNLNLCLQTKTFVGELVTSKMAFLLSLERLRLLAKHCSCKDHFNKNFIEVPAICNQYLEKEEVALHFICGCPTPLDFGGRYLESFPRQRLSTVPVTERCS